MDAGAPAAFFESGDPSGRSVSLTAELLGLTHQRVLALIQAGQLQAEKRSGREGGREDWFVDAESIKSLLRSRMSGIDSTEDEV